MKVKVKLKTGKKLDKYPDLAREDTNILWHLKVTILESRRCENSPVDNQNRLAVTLPPARAIRFFCFELSYNKKNTYHWVKSWSIYVTFYHLISIDSYKILRFEQKYLE